MPHPTVIALDLETTGLDPGDDRVVEIGAIAFDGEELERFESLVRPGRPMGAGATRINGIRDADLVHAPPAVDVLPGFLAFLDRHPGSPLIAHNATFDAGFLGMELARANLPAPGLLVLDTLALARRALPTLQSHRLDALVTHFAIPTRRRHRAIDDAEILRRLWGLLGGSDWAESDHVAYPIRDGSRPASPPVGWESLEEAARSRRPIRMSYAGGTRGDAPRLVTPIRFANRGGIAYLVAVCHLTGGEKSFRIDRIRNYEVLDRPEESPWPACSSA